MVLATIKIVIRPHSIFINKYMHIVQRERIASEGRGGSVGFLSGENGACRSTACSRVVEIYIQVSSFATFNVEDKNW